MESTTSQDHGIQHIEKIISEGYRSISEALEEQNRLLRKLASTLESRSFSINALDDCPSSHPSGEENLSSRKPENDEHAKSGGRNEVALRPPSRLKNMSRASESHDKDPSKSPLHSTSTSEYGATKNARDETSQAMSKSLAQRKKDFMTKTTGRDIRDRTRLAIAAAKREMEREQSKSQELRELERQESNSVGSWLLFLTIGVLGIAAFILGVVARIHQSNFQQHQSSINSSSGEL